ncbi:hypothetical protein LTR70_006251 [Exophiala xenobiotica]|uniref:Uncharacterized protein n=1 Tax=Lithohypha guttulata TaxID=1690604 RepID=A0ABR0JX84_9EURO|nr:hypothetical protein LTR24_009346 [Lithohypha guttulata]KAK5316592.1 hypothetical protein LTR70_006251 [Exophiala xenobiotica]
MEATRGLKRDIVEKVGAARTTSKQEALQAEYKREVQQLDAQVNESAQQHAAWIKQIHRERVQELRDLIMKKMQIEKDIVKTTSELQEAYGRSREIFSVVLDGRIEDCEKNLKQLQDITDNDWEHVEESQEL